MTPPLPSKESSSILSSSSRNWQNSVQLFLKSFLRLLELNLIILVFLRDLELTDPSARSILQRWKWGESNVAGICLRSGNSFLVAGATVDGRPHEIAPLTYCHPSSVTDTLESSLVPEDLYCWRFLRDFFWNPMGS